MGGIRLQSPARVADRGAIVFSPVLISCPAGDQPDVSVTLTERSGTSIAQGFGFDSAVTCTGLFQTVTVTVVPSSKPFVVGTAFGQAGIVDCANPNLGCSSATDQRNVKLTLKK